MNIWIERSVRKCIIVYEYKRYGNSTLWCIKIHKYAYQMHSIDICGDIYSRMVYMKWRDHIYNVIDCTCISLSKYYHIIITFGNYIENGKGAQWRLPRVDIIYGCDSKPLMQPILKPLLVQVINSLSHVNCLYEPCIFYLRSSYLNPCWI